MSDPYTHLNRGDAWKPNFMLHNDLVEMLRERQEESRSQRPESDNAIPFYIVNKSDLAFGIFSVVGIGEPSIPPNPTNESFKFNIVFNSAPPAEDADFAILQSPSPIDGVAEAYISGETWVMVDVADEDHEFALPIDGDYQKLASGDEGAARILWKEDGTGLKWALVLLDPNAGDPADEPTIQIMSATPVEITDDGPIYDAALLVRDPITNTFAIGDPCWFLDLQASTSLPTDETGRYLAHRFAAEPHGPRIIGSSLGNITLLTDPGSVQPWTPVAYLTGSFVTHSGSSYEANADTTGVPGLSGDWTLIAAWSAGAYAAGAVVTHSGAVWTALIDTSATPGTGSDWVQELVTAWALTGTTTFQGTLNSYSGSIWLFIASIPSTQTPGGSDWEDVTATLANVGTATSGLTSGNYGKAVRPTLDGRTDCCDDLVSCCDTTPPPPPIADQCTGLGWAAIFGYNSGDVPGFPNAAFGLNKIVLASDGTTTTSIVVTDINGTQLTELPGIPAPLAVPSTVLVQIYGTGGLFPFDFEGGGGTGQYGQCGGGGWSASSLVLSNYPYTAIYDFASDSVQMKDGSNTVIVKAENGKFGGLLYGTPGGAGGQATNGVGQVKRSGGKGGNGSLVPYPSQGGSGGGAGPGGDGGDGLDSPGDGVTTTDELRGIDNSAGISQGSTPTFTGNGNATGQIAFQWGGASCLAVPVPPPPGDGSGTGPIIDESNFLLPLGVTTLDVTGSGFDTTLANNTLTFTGGGGGVTGTFTTVNSSGTSAIITFGTPPSVAGVPLQLVVTNTVSTQTSGSPVTVANIVTAVTLTDTSGSQTISVIAPTVTLTGSGFSTVPTNNTVTFTTLGAVGYVSASTPTSLIVTFTTLPTGAGTLTGKVTVGGVDSTTEDISVVTNTIPVITLDASFLDNKAPTITINGTGFDGTPANNTIVFSNGAKGTVTASTTTQLTVTFSSGGQPKLPRKMTAIVTVNGVSSASQVVATITASPTLTMSTAVVPWNVVSFTVHGTNFSPALGGTTLLIAYSPTPIPGDELQLITQGGSTTPTSLTAIGNLAANVTLFDQTLIGSAIYGMVILTSNAGAGLSGQNSGWVQIGVVGVATGSSTIWNDAFGGVSVNLASHTPDTSPAGVGYIPLNGPIGLKTNGSGGVIEDTVSWNDPGPNQDYYAVAFDPGTAILGGDSNTYTATFNFADVTSSTIIRFFLRSTTGAAFDGYAVSVWNNNATGGFNNFRIERWEAGSLAASLDVQSVTLNFSTNYTITIVDSPTGISASVNGGSANAVTSEWYTNTTRGVVFQEDVATVSPSTSKLVAPLTLAIS